MNEAWGKLSDAIIPIVYLGNPAWTADYYIIIYYN